MVAHAESKSKVAGVEAHEVALIFLRMTPEEFEALKEDIARVGLRDPITTHEGKIVDGLGRYRACREVGVEPRFLAWDQVGELIDFVVSKNERRRHLTQSQRAVVAAGIARLAEGRPTETARKRAVSQPEAAAKLKVSRTAVQDAAKVLGRGDPGLVRAVKEGKVAVTAAAVVAGLDGDVQAAVVAGGPGAIRAKAKEVREAGKDRREVPADPASIEQVGQDGADPGTPVTDPREADDQLTDDEWLGSLPIRSTFGDPAAFDREALGWRRLQPLLAQARKESPGFDRGLQLRRFRTHRPQLVAYVAWLDHPGRWRTCAACKGSGADTGTACCTECLGDGFNITRCVEP